MILNLSLNGYSQYGLHIIMIFMLCDDDDDDNFLDSDSACQSNMHIFSSECYYNTSSINRYLN